MVKQKEKKILVKQTVRLISKPRDTSSLNYYVHMLISLKYLTPICNEKNDIDMRVRWAVHNK
jgi:hypothetical protein